MSAESERVLIRRQGFGRRRFDAVIRILLGLMTIGIVVLTAAVVVLVVQTARDQSATHKAAAAAKTAAMAAQQATASANRAAGAVTSAEQAKALAAANAAKIAAVQTSRLDACDTTNREHRKTVKDLGAIYTQVSPRDLTRIQRQTLRTSRRATLRIIDDIVPYRNCKKVVGP